MFVPEYSITPRILRNIANIEYCKAIIESTKILPTWEKQLEKETNLSIMQTSLQYFGMIIDTEDLKPYLEGIEEAPRIEIRNIANIIEYLHQAHTQVQIEESNIREVNVIIGMNQTPAQKLGVYRTKKSLTLPNPEEILAEIVQLFDWYNSMESLETHPIIVAAITQVSLILMKPFENFNDLTAHLSALAILRSRGYGIKNSITIIEAYNGLKKDYETVLNQTTYDNADYTSWIEYFTENMSREITSVMEKVKLLAKDTKIAKATGRVELSERQERVIEYLQDYGILQNKDFPRIFPSVSEDTVLRDLKDLLTRGIITKKGKTKSSRYELR